MPTAKSTVAIKNQTSARRGNPQAASPESFTKRALYKQNQFGKSNAARGGASPRLIHAANDSVGQPVVFSIQHLLRQSIALAVRVMMETAEVSFDAQPGGAAEIIDQRQQFFVVSAAGEQAVGSGAGGRHGEQFRADV